MVHYTIEEAITSRDTIPAEVKKWLQIKLDSIESGIEVISVQLTKSEVPRQVKREFEATTKAVQMQSDAITNARSNETKLLNETAGPFAMDLYEAIHDDSVSRERLEDLWSRISGNVKGDLEKARTYASKVVDDAQASAEYFQSLLPEYRKHPDIVINRHYFDTMEKVMSKAKEIFTIQPSTDPNNTELRVNLNRNPSLKTQNKKESQNKE